MKVDAQLASLIRKQATLTDEQKQLHRQVYREWHTRFFQNTEHLLDYRREAEEMVHWLYEQAGLKRPRVILANSPLHARQIADPMSRQEQCSHKKLNVQPAPFGGFCDMGWVALYDFFVRMGSTADRHFIRYRDYLKSIPLFSMIQGRRYCILTPMPTTISLDDSQRLHAERKAAIAWPDGFQLYYWHGLRTRQNYIMEPEKIDRRAFLAERNVEQRRLILEILGEAKLKALLDLQEIDRYVYRSRIPVLDEGQLDQLSQEQIDRLAANVLYETREQTYILYRSRYPDDLIRQHLYFVRVSDPSTDRQYYLSVSPDDATSAKKAVDATFREKDVQYTAEA